MATFEDLDFGAHPSRIGGEMARVFFPNGYGASVVRSQYSFGGREGLYELGVLKGTADGDFGLTYETPVTDDVLGYLTPEDVTRHLGEIEALPIAEGR
jgi:hypothetical protein